MAQAGVAQFAVAGTFLESLAAQDFTRLATTLDEHASLQALVPRGLREWAGAEQIRAAFTSWFGDTRDFDLVDAYIGEVGPRLHLRWRVRMQAQRLGDGWFVVEQQAYAETNNGGRITQLRLLCSGHLHEHTTS